MPVGKHLLNGWTSRDIQLSVLPWAQNNVSFDMQISIIQNIFLISRFCFSSRTAFNNSIYRCSFRAHPFWWSLSMDLSLPKISNVINSQWRSVVFHYHLMNLKRMIAPEDFIAFISLESFKFWIIFVRLSFITALKMLMLVLWVLKPRGLVYRYNRFRKM